MLRSAISQLAVAILFCRVSRCQFSEDHYKRRYYLTVVNLLARRRMATDFIHLQVIITMHISSPIRIIGPWFFLLSSFVTALSAHAEPVLNGIAPFQQLGKDRFVAALYSDSLTDNANEILDTTQQRSMELRITADELSPRRLNRLWIEGMAINNPPHLLTKEADNMVSFTQLIKDKLHRGDSLRLDYRVGAGTEVKVNSVSVGNLPGDQFFDLLLRTWIGSIPLSSTFKNQLLASGNVDDDILNLYNSITPAAERQDIVKQWNKAKQEKAAAQKAAKPNKTDVAPEIAKPSLALVPAVKAPVTIASPTEAKPTPQPLKPQAEAPPKPKVAAQPAAEAKPTLAKAPTKVETQNDEEDEDDTEVLTAASLLDQQRYHSELLRWCYKYLKYPPKAASRNQQGSVRLSVSIDRKGNVTKVNAEEESPYNLLNKEALSAVERANPFPPVPDSIKGERYSFSLPIVFRLPD